MHIIITYYSCWKDPAICQLHAMSSWYHELEL